jgi:CO dehydrogenase/acetyl-CoA synthase epsilon subunit
MLLPILIIAHAAIVALRAEQITARATIAVPAVTVIIPAAIAAVKRKAKRTLLAVAPLPSRVRNVKRTVLPVTLPAVLRVIAAK